jgi:hypothetical protein
LMARNPVDDVRADCRKSGIAREGTESSPLWFPLVDHIGIGRFGFCWA